MSVNKESDQTTSNDEAASNAPTKTFNETKPSASKQPSRLYARLRPSPSSTPARKTSSGGSSSGKEEKIVMDNLPVRATAPANLIDGERSERPSNNRDRNSSRETSSQNERPPESTELNNLSPDQAKKPREGRREREENKGPVFETHSEEEESTPISQIQEFKPSRDHTRKRDSRSSRSREDGHRKANTSTGLFGWLKSLFSSDTESDERGESRERSSRPNYRNGNQRSNQNRRPRGSRGGQNRGDNQHRSRNSNSRNRSSSSR